MRLRNGCSEAVAVCPGERGIEQRERRDEVPRGLYRRLIDDGVLLVDEGRRMARIETLIEHVFGSGIRQATIYCDRFLVGQLRDAVAGRAPVVERATRWFSETEDIAAFRRMAPDGPLAVEPACHALMRVALSAAAVKSDD